jgi:hypothetical protein
METYNAISKTTDINIWKDGYRAIIESISPISPEVCEKINKKFFEIDNI